MRRPTLFKMNASVHSILRFVLLAVFGIAAVAAVNAPQCRCNGTPLTTLQPPDPCSGVVCQNGGTCEADGQSFLCVCTLGYEGEFCQDAVGFTSCDGVNCNRGRCVQENGVARCDCEDGGTGVFCENDLCLSIDCGAFRGPIECVVQDVSLGDNSDPFFCDCPEADSIRDTRFCHGVGCTAGIEGSLCLFNGECDDSDEPDLSDGSESCICNDGFFGDSCQYGACSEDMCQNGASCLFLGGFIGCDCRDGFEGDSCEIATCFGNSCENGGTCVVEGDTFTCNCAEGFGGDLCETDLSECFGLSCLNGGTCIGTSAADVECVCTEGISGDRCQFGNCFSQPATFCQNGGSCIGASLDEVACFCAAGFSGVMCELGPCPPNVVCENGGRCVIVNGEFNSCRCLQGFFGDRCESTEQV